jgi:deoxyribodipyrimidine photo-lyase
MRRARNRLPPAMPPPAGRVALLLHEDDLHPESLDLGEAAVAAIAGFGVPERRSPLPVAPAVTGFVRGALADGLARAGRHFGVPAAGLAPEADWALATGCRAVVAPWAPVGWTAEALPEVAQALRTRGIALHRLRRPWDEAAWPLATRGFFPFRARADGLLAAAQPPGS